jgi:hypothetical protein
MSSIARYWRLVRLDGTGNRRAETLTIAKEFFAQQFADEVSQGTGGDLMVQKRLVQVLQDPMTHLVDRSAAELCLRCFISHQIEQTCIQLEEQFGGMGGFTRRDLFAVVLDDDGRIADGQGRSAQTSNPGSDNRSAYQTLSSQILQTFDPDRAALSTFARRQIKQSSELTAYLLEHGIYLMSDWAILNNTRLEQVPRILEEFHGLSSNEIDAAVTLLKSYHAVYRHDRLQQRQLGRISGCSICTLPTTEQLIRMAQELVTPNLSSETVLSQLQSLATRLRQYRIHVRGGSQFRTESLDQPEIQSRVLEMQSAPSEEGLEEDEQAFLSFYQAQFSECLDESIDQAIDDRVAYLQRKKTSKVTQFLEALKLFHCRGKAMGEIAAQVGLTAQFQVTRLMKLKEFRASVRQLLLQKLRDRVIEKVKTFTDSARLQSLDRQIDLALEEKISTVMQQAEAEAVASKSRSQPISLFSQRLCHHLDLREVQP